MIPRLKADRIGAISGNIKTIAPPSKMYSSFSTPWRPQPLFTDSPSWLNSSSSTAQFANNSVHLSPEELAAIEHGIASVYGKLPNAELDAGFVPNNYGTVFEKENHSNNNNYSVTSNLNNNYSTASNLNANSNFATGNLNNNYNTSSNFNNNYNNSNNLNNAGKNDYQTNDYGTPLSQPTAQQRTQTPKSDYRAEPFATPFNNTFAGKENFAAPSPKIVDDFLSPPRTAPQVDKVLQQERQRYAAMEQHYRRELERLKQNNLEYSERLRLEQTIQDLRKRIGDLEMQLQQSRRQTSDDRLAAMQLYYDRKISALTRQFEQEKQSHAEIMRARMKAEINLLVPKIKAQCQAALERSGNEAVSKLKSQASTYISKMKQDFEMEKQVLKEHMKRRFDQELRSMSSQMQQKFELKLAQERNVLERKYLDRKEQRNVNTFSFEPSFLL